MRDIMRMAALVVILVCPLARPDRAAGLPASIVDHGSFLHDAGSGLDWLDLTFTNGLSLPAIASTFLIDGWAVASVPQVSTLLEHAGIPLGNHDPQDPDVFDLQGLLGLTRSIDTFQFTLGWTAEVDGLDRRTASLAWCTKLLECDVPSAAGPGAGQNSIAITTGQEFIAWWLTRPHVDGISAPASLTMLLAGGIAGLLVRERALGRRSSRAGVELGVRRPASSEPARFVPPPTA
jgi:hypothetical protein